MMTIAKWLFVLILLFIVIAFHNDSRGGGTV